jgi:hypothetical protein
VIKKRLMALTILGLLLSSLVLGACDGMTRLDIDVDPDTGEGTIDIIGGGDGDDTGDSSGDTSGGDDSSNEDGVQTAIIFATVVALLLGVLAIVMSLANRPRNVD